MRTPLVQEETSGGQTRRFVLRILAGFLAGGVVGAPLGALTLILLIGPAEYARSLGDHRPAGIISGSGTEAGFTAALTYVFALCGAAVGAPLGFLAALFTSGRKSPGEGGEPR